MGETYHEHATEVLDGCSIEALSELLPPREFLCRMVRILGRKFGLCQAAVVRGGAQKSTGLVGKPGPDKQSHLLLRRNHLTALIMKSLLFGAPDHRIRSALPHRALL